MHPELLHLVEDYERLWTVAGFAEHFAASLARPTSGIDDPYQAVLAEHRRRLVAALRGAQERGELSAGRDPDEIADALVGFYLSRRLGRGRLGGWARTAIAAIVN